MKENKKKNPPKENNKHQGRNNLSRENSEKKL